MARGTVRWFSRERSYGFIVPEDGSEDLFVHHTCISGEGFKSLDEGARVSYEATRGRKGMQAVNVSAVPAAGHQRARVNPGVEVGPPARTSGFAKRGRPASERGTPFSSRRRTTSQAARPPSSRSARTRSCSGHRF